MENYSALAILLEALEPFIPDNKREDIARKANESLEEGLRLATWFNQLAATYPRDSGDEELLSTSLNYINLALTELSQVSNSIRITSELKVKTANRAKVTFTPDSAIGGTE